ncbi:unnamed protein product, partial [Prorocentrum cordatum]
AAAALRRRRHRGAAGTGGPSARVPERGLRRGAGLGVRVHVYGGLLRHAALLPAGPGAVAVRSRLRQGARHE